jgi:hypothetical protein
LLRGDQPLDEIEQFFNRLLGSVTCDPQGYKASCAG